MHSLKNLIERFLLRRSSPSTPWIGSASSQIVFSLTFSLFLTTKDTVVTSIVSTRWKHLCDSCPNLDLDDYQSFRNVVRHRSPGDTQKFVSFVNRMLLLRNSSPMHRFSLICYARHDIAQINSWIVSAVQRGFREIVLEIETQRSYRLPSDLFTCKTLVVLKLFMALNLMLPNVVQFPSLKVLHLFHLTYCGSHLLGRLFSACPVLEEFQICDCKFPKKEIIDISIPTLKELAIEDGNENKFDGCEIVLDLPSLEYLYIDAAFPQGYTMKNMNSLVESPADMLHPSPRLNCSLETLEATSKVQSSHLPMDLNEDSMHYSGNGFPEHELSFHHLREVELNQFTGHDSQLNFVRYLLQSSKVLKKMTLKSVLPGEESSIMGRALLLFPRCSRTCKIIIK